MIKLEVTDANASQSVVKLTLSNPTADDVVDVTAELTYLLAGYCWWVYHKFGSHCSNVSLTDESSDTTCFPVFGTSYKELKLFILTLAALHTTRLLRRLGEEPPR